MEGLSHKSILGEVIRFMEKGGYKRIKLPNSLGTRHYQGHHLYQELYAGGVILAPDAIFYREGEKFIDSVDVKPEYSSIMGIRVGIGQCIESMIMGLRPFIATTDNFLSYLLDIVLIVPFIGIICCYKTGTCIVNNPELTETKASQKLLADMRNGFKFISKDGQPQPQNFRPFYSFKYSDRTNVI